MTAPHALSFGDLLRRHRMAAGLTQEELAERAGLSARAVSDIERGVKARPHRETVRLLAEALGLDGPPRAAFEAARGRVSAGTAGPSLMPSGRHGETVPPLVGRTAELALLERHLGGEGPPVLLLAGEPGIGKSRLLREAGHRAPAHGWTVLSGGCQRRGGQEPYAPLLPALAGHLRAQSPAQLRASLRGCAWLVRLLPELAGGPIEPLPDWTLPPEQERRLMVAAVERYLANVAGTAGTLLLLDDLQWAGPDALDLLATLMRTNTAPALRVIGTYRDIEVQPQDALSEMLADLAQAGLAGQRALSPLEPPEVDRLLDALLAGDGAPEVRARVAQRAGGVPFFLVICARALRVGAVEGSASALPWDVAQGVRQRVTALPTTAQQVLGAAAVLGRVVQPHLLTAVAGQPEPEVLAALDAASRARLLVEDKSAYQFAHDLIREVVEAEVGAARRALLHRRIAEALERQAGTPPVELLAYHYGQSGEHGKAAAYLEQAGDDAARIYANAVALGHYEEARRRRVLTGADEPTLARLDEKRGAVLHTMARYDEALAALGQAAETYQAAGDVESLGRTMAQIGRAHDRRGTPLEGIARLQPLLRLLPSQEPSPGLAALYAALPLLYFFSGQYSEQLAAAERAWELAHQVGDDRLVGQAGLALGWTLPLLGRGEEGLQVLEEAITRAEALGDLYTLSEALGSVGLVCAYQGQFERSRAAYDRGLAAAERLGDPDEIAHVISQRGAPDFLGGQWVQARQAFERGLAMTRRVEASSKLVYALSWYGKLLFHTGEWETAVRYLEEGSTLAARNHELQGLRAMQSCLAERDLMQGRPDAAHARLVPLLDRPGLEEQDVTLFLPTLAWAHLDLDEVAVAQEMVGQAVRRARAQSLHVALVDALRVQAMVAIRQEQWEEATSALEEGLELAHSMPYPYAEGRLLHVYGEMRLQKGEPAPARERLEAALVIFRRLGARKDVERVEQALGSLPDP